MGTFYFILVMAVFSFGAIVNLVLTVHDRWNEIKGGRLMRRAFRWLGFH